VSSKIYELIPSQRVAFIGLGAMGGPMAGHLARAGHHVTVFNRSADKAVQWVAQYGGAHAATPRLAATDADIVFACVGNDEHLRAMTTGPDGAFAGMQPGAVFMDHTTASAAIARELGAAAHARGLEFIDAPVSGGTLGAENGTLTVMCGGEPAAFDLAQPVALAFASAVTRVGAHGAGQLAKMVNQICVVGLAQSLAEAIAFGQKSGLDMKAVLKVLGKGAAQSWQMEHRGPTMIDGEFDFGFAVDWMRKDLGLVLDEAKLNGARLPVAALVDQFYADLQALGGRRWDISSLIKRLQ